MALIRSGESTCTSKKNWERDYPYPNCPTVDADLPKRSLKRAKACSLLTSFT